MNGSLEKRIARIEAVTHNEHLLAKSLGELFYKAICIDGPLSEALAQAIRDTRTRLLEVINDTSYPAYVDILLEAVATVLDETEDVPDSEVAFYEGESDVNASWNMR